MFPHLFKPAAKDSRRSLPSGDAATVTFTTKKLFIPAKTAKRNQLNLSSAFCRPFEPQNKPKLQKCKNPKSPFQGVVDAYIGFTHHVSNFLSANPPGGGDRNKPTSPFHGIVDVFKGCTHHLTNRPPPLFIERKHHDFLSELLLCPHAVAKDNNQSEPWDSHDLRANLVLQLNKLSALKRYKVSAIKFVNPRTRSVVPAAAEAFGDLHELPRPGGFYTKEELTQALQHLSSCPFFEKIDFEAQTKPDGSIDINIPFREMVYPSKTKFSCISVDGLPDVKPVEMDPDMTLKEQIEAADHFNEQQRRRLRSAPGCILPGSVQREIETMMVKQPNLSGALLKNIMEKVSNWYHSNGYVAANVYSMSNPMMDPRGEMMFEMMEGKINKLGVRFEDSMGNCVEGDTDKRVIKRALPKEVAVGKVFNMREFEKARLNIGSLGLFSSSGWKFSQDEKSGVISADFVLHEKQSKWSEVETSCNIVPGQNLLSILLSCAGAKISVGHRNIKGLNRSLEASVNLSSLFNPESDDIGWNVEYKHPYFDGIDNPRNRTLNVVGFNSRKVSPVFRGSPNTESAPIWVDRVGAKATITEDFTPQSRFTYGVVGEDIRTRDQEGDVVGRAARLTVNRDGPPTTLSGTGVDRIMFLQANITRDTTRFVNGLIVGGRNVFQVDQGLGIGIKSPFFNRFKLSGTQFIPLKKVEGEAAAVLVLHGLYGGCVGDLPNHEAFTLGGPYSVRGYDVGEIGASRHKLEVAGEVRLAIADKYTRVKGGYVYAFGEHGNDLGSSGSLQGNPTESYMRKGQGSSYGAGINLCNFRLEYAVDHNAGEGSFSVRFGDRF